MNDGMGIVWPCSVAPGVCRHNGCHPQVANSYALAGAQSQLLQQMAPSLVTPPRPWPGFAVYTIKPARAAGRRL